MSSVVIRSDAKSKIKSIGRNLRAVGADDSLAENGANRRAAIIAVRITLIVIEGGNQSICVLDCNELGRVSECSLSEKNVHQQFFSLVRLSFAIKC